MASLDSLPSDQRAVLQMVLQRGRTYDEIAQMLSIDRAAVRQRALAAFDALGPQTGVEDTSRALITDYLLGQLPDRARDETRERLGKSASERAWARVLASELSPLAGGRLPEIPTDDPSGTAPQESAPPGASREPAPRPTSRLGGAILLGLGVLIAVVVVVVLLSNGSKSAPAPHAASTPASVTAATTATATTPTQVVAQINLLAPGGAASPRAVAQVVRQGTITGVVIVGSGVAANSRTDAYAVWLFKPPATAKILGFVNPGVGPTGRLQTAGRLPAEATQYSQLLVTRETQANPKGPGRVVLQGNLKLG